jgi:uracil-DNA glycosylase family 4
MQHRKGTGPIWFIFDSPEGQEERAQEVMVGGHARLFKKYLEQAGIPLHLCSFFCLGSKRNSTQEELVSYHTKKIFPLIRIELPKCIVPMGKIALSMVAPSRYRLDKWRGSILTMAWGSKIIPTYHPASIMRNQKLEAIFLNDLEKVKREWNIPFTQKERKLVLAPSFQGVMQYLDNIGDKISFDLETTRAKEEGSHVHITTFGIATSSTSSICIPFSKKVRGKYQHFYNEWEEVEIWKKLGKIMQDEKIKKIAQHGQFDCGVLLYLYHLKVQPLYLDTMAGFHALYSELPKDLDTLTSLYTDIGYYGYKSKGSQEEFWSYNCYDCLATYEAAEKIEEEMKEANVWEYYEKVTRPLIDSLIAIECRGVPIDKEERARQTLEAEAVKLTEEILLSTEAGGFVNANPSNSLKYFLYEHLKLPKKRSGKGGLATDEETLLSFMKRTPSNALARILKIRKLGKKLGTYLRVPLQKGRMHTSYGVGATMKKDSLTSAPVTGRLSSGKNIVMNSGTNLQNQPRDKIRKIFIPEEGYTWFKVDLAQAEARVTAYLAKEERMINVFETGGDIHTLNASWFFNKELKDVTKDERQAAKGNGTHGFNYGLTARGHSANTGMPLNESTRLYDLYFENFPRILGWQGEVEEKLRSTRTLTTPFGYRRLFLGRVDHNLVKSGLSFIPQHTVATIINIALIRAENIFTSQAWDGAMFLQVHDEIDFQLRDEEVEKFLGEKVLDTIFNIPTTIEGKTFVIPYDASYGKNWYELEDVK